MEQIIKLLVAATIATIFGLVLLFSLAVYSKNGGQYWGFDGKVEPEVAASISFESGDFRFLFVKLKRPLGDQVSGAPNRISCLFHDPTTEGYLRANQIDAESSVDDVETVFAFAASYNGRIGDLLQSEFPTKCGRSARTELAVPPNNALH